MPVCIKVSVHENAFQALYCAVVTAIRSAVEIVCWYASGMRHGAEPMLISDESGWKCMTATSSLNPERREWWQRWQPHEIACSLGPACVAPRSGARFALKIFLTTVARDASPMTLDHDLATPDGCSVVANGTCPAMVAWREVTPYDW